MSEVPLYTLFELGGGGVGGAVQSRTSLCALKQKSLRSYRGNQAIRKRPPP